MRNAIVHSRQVLFSPTATWKGKVWIVEEVKIWHLMFKSMKYEELLTLQSSQNETLAIVCQDD